MATYNVFYTLRDSSISHFFLDADSSIEALESAARRYPHIKTFFKADRIYSHKAVQDELSFTWTQAVVNFIRALANTKTKFYVEGNSDVSKEIEDKYRDLTMEVIVPMKGVYNIAPNQKWGVEGTIYFESSILVPEDLGVEPEKPGQINSTKLFWTLIRMGFRLSGEHKINEIENSIPVEFRRVAGVV